MTQWQWLRNLEATSLLGIPKPKIPILHRRLRKTLAPRLSLLGVAHIVGTMRMDAPSAGPLETTNFQGVVDTSLLIRGFDNLYVWFICFPLQSPSESGTQWPWLLSRCDYRIICIPWTPIRTWNNVSVIIYDHLRCLELVFCFSSITASRGFTSNIWIFSQLQMYDH